MKTVTENDHIINCIARATRLAINGNAPIDDAKNTNSVPCQKKQRNGRDKQQGENGPLHAARSVAQRAAATAALPSSAAMAVIGNTDKVALKIGLQHISQMRAAFTR